MIRMSYATLRSQGFFLCFDALHGVATSCHVIHRQEGGNGGGAAESIAPLRAGAGSPQAAGVAWCPPQRGGRVQLTSTAAAGKGVWGQSTLRGRKRLPARRHAHRLALCKKTIDLLLACKVSQDCSVPQHTPETKRERQQECAIPRSKWMKSRLHLHVQWFLSLCRLLLWAVADESISVWQVQVECDEWTMLHAQSTQGGAINLQHTHNWSELIQVSQVIVIILVHFCSMLQLFKRVYLTWKTGQEWLHGFPRNIKMHVGYRIFPPVLLNAQFGLVRRCWLMFYNSRPDNWCACSKPLYAISILKIFTGTCMEGAPHEL